MAVKPILCVDFDGVIHSYDSGWKGAHIIPDVPVLGAIDFLRGATEHFTVSIFSSRSHQDGGIDAMKRWLTSYAMLSIDSENPDDFKWLADIEWPLEKPPALVTIDDRAITFTGAWPAFADLLAFKPWNKK